MEVPTLTIFCREGREVERDPVVRDLLKAFASLAAAVITIDAMHTQHDTAQLITSRGADYVMTVEANMPTLYRQLKKPHHQRPRR